jgi:hypothetical protein
LPYFVRRGSSVGLAFAAGEKKLGSTTPVLHNPGAQATAITLRLQSAHQDQPLLGIWPPERG